MLSSKEESHSRMHPISSGFQIFLLHVSVIKQSIQLLSHINEFQIEDAADGTIFISLSFYFFKYIAAYFLIL